MYLASYDMCSLVEAVVILCTRNIALYCNFRLNSIYITEIYNYINATLITLKHATYLHNTYMLYTSSTVLCVILIKQKTPHIFLMNKNLLAFTGCIAKRKMTVSNI